MSRLVNTKQILAGNDNYVLASTGNTANWLPLSAITTVVESLNDLSDVTTGLPTTPTIADDGKILFYDFDTSQWITDDTVTHGTVVINTKKSTAGTIAKGLPVYLVGFDGDIHTVEVANAASASTMPVIGLAGETLDNTNSKHVITFGKITGIDTTSGGTIANGESWSVNDDLYVDTTTGELTNVRPVGATTQIQRVAKVLRVDASGGQLFVFNTARTAGLPNLTQDYVWVGNSNNQPVEVLASSLGSTLSGTPNTISMFNTSGDSVTDSIITQQDVTGVTITTDSGVGSYFSVFGEGKLYHQRDINHWISYDATSDASTYERGVLRIRSESGTQPGFEINRSGHYIRLVTNVVNRGTINVSSLLNFTVGTSAPHTRVNQDGEWGFGLTLPTAKVHIQGDGSTSATTAFRVQNSSASQVLEIRDDSRLIYTDGNQGDGKVLTSDASGVATWQDPSGFTGNTSGDCITDLWVSNIHSCSPLNINPNNEGDINIGTAFTYEINNKRLKIGGATALSTLALRGEGTSSARYSLWAENNPATFRMYFTDSGTFRIGTSTNNNYFQQSTQFTTQFSNSATYTGFLANRDGNFVSMYGSGANSNSYINTSNRLWFTTNATTGGPSSDIALGIDTNKNVMVGNFTSTQVGSASLHIKGQGSTDATTSLLIENSSGTDAIEVTDDANVGIGPSGPAQTFARLNIKGLGTDNTTRAVNIQTSGGVTKATIWDGGLIASNTTSTVINSYESYLFAGDETITESTGFRAGTSTNFTANPSVNGTMRVIGNYSRAQKLGSNNLNVLIGSNANAVISGTGNVGLRGVGLEASVSNNSSGTAGTVFAISANIQNNGAATMTHFGVLDLRMEQTTGGSNITNMYGIRINAPTNVGTTTISNTYSIHMADNTEGTNNYGIYQTALENPNYLRSRTGFGAIPNDNLDVDIDGGYATRYYTETAFTGNTDNYDLPNSSFVRITSTGGAINFTGIANPSNGRRVTFVNTSSSAITFKHQDANSTAANRLVHGNAGGDKVLNQNDTIEYMYDTVIDKWLYIGGSI